MKALYLFLTLLLAVWACKTGTKETANTTIDDEKGLIGFVELTEPLDQDLIKQGTEIYTNICSKCHTLDTAQFVVPSFAGVTNRRSPEWIMNMIVNVDQMLERDPVAGELLKKHKIQMPDPNLSVDQARAVLEFLRNNDVQQVGERDKGVN